MEIYQLRTFVTVARTGHLTRAAEQLATSQPAVSAQLKALEEELKVLLFIRTAKGMMLTAAGKDLLENAERILNESENLLQRARTHQTELVGTLRIGLNEDGNYLKIEQLCRFVSLKFKELKLDIHNSNSHAILKDIEEDRLDCGFVFGGFNENKFSGIVLHSERIVIAVPFSWEERIAGTSWKDLLEFPWALQTPGCPYLKKAEGILKSMNLKVPESIFSADQDATVLAIVSSGSSIGLVKEADAIQAAEQGKIVIWEGGVIDIDLCFVFKRDRRFDNFIQGVSTIVKQTWDQEAISYSVS